MELHPYLWCLVLSCLTMLKLLLILSSLIACTLGAAIQNQLDGRIVGGDITRISEFPWQVSVQRNGTHDCGGAIYNKRIIITAAHCLDRVPMSEIKIRAGSTYWNSGGVLLTIDAMKIHDDYDIMTAANDIALLRLSEELTFSSTIKNIGLATKTPLNGAASVVAGWGILKEQSLTLPLQLHKADLKIIQRTQCASRTFDYGRLIKSSMICAGASGKDSCHADSGGPLVSEGLVVGIVSFGRFCASDKYPGVYADVVYLGDWLRDNIKGLEAL